MRPVGTRPGDGRDGLPSRPSPGSRSLLLIGVLMMAVFVASTGAMVMRLHRDALAEAQQNVSKLGTAISEQTARSLQAGDRVLGDIAGRAAAGGVGSAEEFKAWAGSPEVFRILENRAGLLPQVNAFSVAAADGTLLACSCGWPVAPVDVAGRDDAAWLREHDTAAPYVSAPVREPGNGTWTAHLVRRVNAPSGAVLGMVTAAVDLRYFEDSFRAVTAGDGTDVALLRSDGTVLASIPPEARAGEAAADLPPDWTAGAGPGAAAGRTPGARIASAHSLDGYPLAVTVSVAEWDALSAWLRTTVVAGLCNLLACLCVAVLLHALRAQFRRLELSEGLLASRNAALEETQLRLEAQAAELSAGRAQLAEQSGALQAALDHMNHGLAMVAADGTMVVCNERAMRLLGLPPELLASRPSFDQVTAYQWAEGEFVHTPYGSGSITFAQAMSGPRTYERERRNGSIIAVETVPMEGGGMVRTYTDVTDRRRSERQVQFLAHHDGLTGLVNRTVFQERVAAMIPSAAAEGTRLAVFYLDLDGFKLVNDTYGHGVGDELLVAVARRLQAALRASDLAARIGGDEFAVLQPLRAPGDDPVELATRLLAAIGEEFQLGQRRCLVGVSIGIAVCPDHSGTAAALLRDADTALYRAKASGRRTFRMFDPEMASGQQARFLLEQDLTRALAEGQFFLEYQPIVSASTLQPVRYEALLRWRHPERGEVGPEVFIAIAEACGLIVPIGQWVLRTACADAAGWLAEAAVSVNLSPVQFARGGLADAVEQVLRQTGLPASRLNLEITEGVLIENTGSVVQAMAQLRRRGIRFSLDDFGTAHAGLTYLRRFSFDVLKVDKSFVQDAAKGAQARAILASIQAIGAACNLEVVAEGVETKEELAVVQALGCSHVQGYLTGRPGPAAAAVRTRRRGAGHLTLVQPS